MDTVCIMLGRINGTLQYTNIRVYHTVHTVPHSEALGTNVRTCTKVPEGLGTRTWIPYPELLHQSMTSEHHLSRSHYYIPPTTNKQRFVDNLTTIHTIW